MAEETAIYDNLQDDPQTSGHPKGLYVLFFSEMWERFCYYGMRTLLTLYLVKSLLKGDAEASLIYGAYTGLVYAAPILGGRMADKFLGYRYAVILGGILMAIGEFIILGGNEQMLMIGMGALIIGNGYFKANISTIVGKLYKDGDPRRDSGFTIFYIGINVGALLATTVVAYVGETYGFDKGFALAGIGMLLGIFIFWAGRSRYAMAPGVNFPEAGLKKLFGPVNYIQAITVGSLFLIPLCYVLILKNELLNYIFLALFLYVAYTLIKAGTAEDKLQNTKIWKDRMISLVIFILINVVFWACFEQAGTSLTLFADRNVDREIFGWVMPASMTQFFNPFFIVLFGSFFSLMWIKLSKMGKNPNIPLKFAFGIFQLGLGFLITYVGFTFSENNLVPLLTLVFLYMLHTTGELFLSPIGLSMVTKLAPKQIAGTAMGAWFISFAIANFLGGQIATLTGGGHGGGGEQEEAAFTSSTTLKDAFVLTSNEAGFDSWNGIIENVPKRYEDYRVPKNLTVGKWQNINDWLIFRESLLSNDSYGTWVAKKQAQQELATPESWLQEDLWNKMRERYARIYAMDTANYDNAIKLKDWNYYGGGFHETELSADQGLQAAFTAQIDVVQKDRLDKYVSVFTWIGLVLVGFSLLLVLFNKPLEKLMHGVE